MLVFKDFKTVYEAHGFFHSTLTPPLVVAIFLGVFWRRFTPAGVLTSFIGGVALMILGSHYPAELIGPFAQGTPFDPKYPYIYIQALYNLLVCFGIAVIATYSDPFLKQVVTLIDKSGNSKLTYDGFIVFSVAFFILVIFNYGPIWLLFTLCFVLAFLVAILATKYINYDPHKNTFGLTAWSINEAREKFKGSKVNDIDGKNVNVSWKLIETEAKDDSSDNDFIYFSQNDMKTMAAEVGDLVYISDHRWYFGGLKSIHSKFGTPHTEDGVVYISKEQQEVGQFVKNVRLTAEKEF